jgi:hypothetical protein
MVANNYVFVIVVCAKRLEAYLSTKFDKFVVVCPCIFDNEAVRCMLQCHMHVFITPCVHMRKVYDLTYGSNGYLGLSPTHQVRLKLISCGQSCAGIKLMLECQYCHIAGDITGRTHGGPHSGTIGAIFYGEKVQRLPLPLICKQCRHLFMLD